MTREEFINEFEMMAAKMVETMKRKNADYSGANDNPFHNFEMVEMIGAASTEQGFYTRMTDKMMRVASFIKKGELLVKDESAQDTLQDLAVYSMLFALYLKSKQ